MTRLMVILAATLVSAACGKKPDASPAPPAAEPSAQTSAPSSEPAHPPIPDEAPPASLAPWRAAPIPASSIPRVYLDVWRVAANRSRCALLAPVALGAEDSSAAPRKATFSGGWAVAYDLPQLRSAFGIAGSASDPQDPDVYSKWPNNISWPDGSSASYGLEAGTGPNWLAYVKIPGQECLYNVWSRRGQSHLEAIIRSLRFVSVK